jgi:hypothetical protein
MNRKACIRLQNHTLQNHTRKTFGCYRARRVGPRSISYVNTVNLRDCFIEEPPLFLTNENSALRRFFLVVAKAIVILYVILDGIASPIIRPLLRWVAKLRFVISLQDIVATLPPYAILLLLGVPLAFAEPAKIYALVLMGQGHFVTGLVTIAMAYLVSLVVVERIYHAGQAKLKTILWFAKLMDWLTGNRDRLLAWARATMIWKLSVEFKQTARALVAKLRHWFPIG